MNTLSQPYIFISYCHKDLGIVKKDIRQLERLGVRIWFDENLYGGTNWLKTVRSIINDSLCVGTVFFLSKNSIISSAVLKEMNFVRSRRRSDNNYKYASVNIDGKKVSKLIASCHKELSDKTIIKLLQMFNDEIKFFVRSSDNKNEYFALFQKTMVQWGALDDKEMLLLEDFETKTDTILGEPGICISRYNGVDKHAVVPAYINGMRVLEIGEHAFYNAPCDTITISDGVRKIGSHCFENCKKLKSISLPDSVVEIGYEAFRNDASLSFISLPSQLARLGNYCFYLCRNLKSIVFNNSKNICIGFACFSACTALETVTLPMQISELGALTFSNCESLKTLRIEGNVDTIGQMCMHNCGSLQTIFLGSFPKCVGKDLFRRCSNLQAIVVPQSLYEDFVHSNNWHAYKDKLRVELEPPSFVKIVSNDIIWENNPICNRYAIKITKGFLRSKRSDIFQVTEARFHYVFLYNNIYEIQVATLASSPLQRNSSWSTPLAYGITNQDFIIEDDGKTLVKYIGKKESVIIPEGITTLADQAFMQTNIKSVHFPSSLVLIGNEAFSDCTDILQIDLPNNLQIIGERAFSDCEKLRQITFPSSTTTIGKSAFCRCAELKYIDLSKTKIFEVPQKCFYRCEKMVYCILPSTVTCLREGCFRGAVALERVEYHKESCLQYIEDNVFSFNVAMKQLYIPASVKKIGVGIIYESTAVKEIVSNSSNFQLQSNSLVHIKDSCLMCYPIDADAKYSNMHVKIVMPNAMSDLEWTEHIYIYGLQKIMDNNFCFCKQLTEVILEGNKIDIKNNCFSNNHHLLRVRIHGTPGTIGSNCFTDNAIGFKIVVDLGNLDLFKTKSAWAPYIGIMEESLCN